MNPPGIAGRQALLDRAQQVPDANWTGGATLASRSLYPHQWSWDAAFVAIGRSWAEPALAMRELETMFQAQWANGMLPHIRRYWRGPVWMNTDWLLWRGLRRHAHAGLAREIEDSMVALVERSGFREYFDPFTGEGYGSLDFSWSAALLIDVLRSGPTAGTTQG